MYEEDIKCVEEALKDKEKVSLGDAERIRQDHLVVRELNRILVGEDLEIIG
jgi:hypothetical protein